MAFKAEITKQGTTGSSDHKIFQDEDGDLWVGFRLDDEETITHYWLITQEDGTDETILVEADGIEDDYTLTPWAGIIKLSQNL